MVNCPRQGVLFISQSSRKPAILGEVHLQYTRHSSLSYLWNVRVGVCGRVATAHNNRLIRWAFDQRGSDITVR